MVSLNLYHFPEVRVKANPHWKGGDPKLGEITIDPSIVKDSETGNYFYNLIVSNDDEDNNSDASYHFHIYAFAVLEVEEELADVVDEIATDVAYQGAAILFGVVRDHLFSITAKSAWGGIQLPIYRFKDENFEGKFFLMEKPETEPERK